MLGAESIYAETLVKTPEASIFWKSLVFNISEKKAVLCSIVCINTDKLGSVIFLSYNIALDHMRFLC